MGQQNTKTWRVVLIKPLSYWWKLFKQSFKLLWFEHLEILKEECAGVVNEVTEREDPENHWSFSEDVLIIFILQTDSTLK